MKPTLQLKAKQIKQGEESTDASGKDEAPAGDAPLADGKSEPGDNSEEQDASPPSPISTPVSTDPMAAIHPEPGEQQARNQTKLTRLRLFER